MNYASSGRYRREVRSVYCEEIIGSLPPRLKSHYSFLPSLSIFCITPGGKVFGVWFSFWAYLSGAVLRRWRCCRARVPCLPVSAASLLPCFPASPAPPTNRLLGRGVWRQREAVSHVDVGTALDHLMQVSPCHVNSCHAWLLRYRACLFSPTNKKRF